MPRSFDSVFYGAAGSSGDPVDDQFNRVSFLSHFDGTNNGVNSTFDDGSASNHTITAAGNVTQGSFGPFARPDGEWGVSLDGDSDYLDANDGPTFGTGAFTIEFFVNHRAITTNHIMFDSRPDGTNGLYPMIWINSSGTLQYYVSTSSVISGGTMTTNTWHHVAVSRTSTSTKMFLDGTQVGSTYSDSNNYVDSGRMRVGTSAFQVSDGYHVDGIISNWRVVNSALYTSNFTAPTGKLTAVTNTKLLTCQSNRFVDNSADGLTMTPRGGAAVTAFGPFLTSEIYSAGTNGASGYFDGSGDALSTSSMTVNGTGNFTLEFWAYMTSTGGNRTFATFNDAGGATNILQYYVRNGEFKLYSNAGGVRTFSGGYASKNQWAFIHLSRSGSTATLKVNNVSYGTVSSSENLNGVLGIGAYVNASTGDPYVGYMCDYRVSNTIRSSAIPTEPLGTDSNTKLLLNMADGQAIDQVAKSNIVLEGNAVTSTTQKKIGTASFYSPGGDGDKGLINTAGGALLPPYNWTIEVWTYCTNSAANQVVFAQGLSGGAGRVALGIEGSVYLLQIGTAKPQHNARTLNQWVHLCATYDGTTAKLYIDGTLASSGSVSYTTATDQNLQAGIGNLGTGWDTSAYGKWYGYIDELRVSRFIRHTGNFSPNTEAFPDKGQ